jgi:transposase InsO family protein
MAVIDWGTREILAWHVELRRRADDAIALVERAAAAHGIQAGELTLGSDNGAAFTARGEQVREEREPAPFGAGSRLWCCCPTRRASSRS